MLRLRLARYVEPVVGHLRPVLVGLHVGDEAVDREVSGMIEIAMEVIAHET
jgi:hypothetical protein